MIRYLYKITNQINHKIYIGVHRSKRKTDSYMGSGLSIKNAIKKYGKENFIKEILEYFESDEDMFAREKEIVNEDFITNLENYNLIVGRKGVGAGHLHPMFGKKRPKHSEFMKTHSPSKGKPCPQSVKDKISQSNTGRKHSPEVNKKRVDLVIEIIFLAN
jgi:group I intron endonuclease